MFKVIVKLEDVVTNYAEFQTMSECNDWVDFHKFYDNRDVSIVNISQEVLLKKQSEEALQYLRDTDYLVIKEIELGVPCSDEIKQLRADARLKVIK